MIITIDGPAGSGKSSVARSLAQKLQYLHLNSGILYRAIGYLTSAKGISYEDEGAIKQVVDGLEVDFILNVVDFRTDIRLFFRPDGLALDPKVLSSDEWSQGASKVGTLPYVREVLTRMQRQVGAENNVVLEGRDSGSVVFPMADFKFYLNASLEERVRRRVKQEYGEGEVFDSQVGKKILAEIQRRDLRDSTRSIAPQVIPEDAKVIETENLSMNDVVDVICKIVRPEVKSN